MNNPVKLTASEEKILQEIFSGKTSKEVAEGRFTSKRTVDFHIARAYEKAKELALDLGLPIPERLNRIWAQRVFLAAGFFDSAEG